MVNLSANWLTEGLIDFEYKKYLLLAYLQEAARQFDEKKLYPKLSELVEHYRQLKLFSEQKQMMANNFPKQISRVDLEKLKIEYNSLFTDSDLLQELDSIVAFAQPKIEEQLGLGKELYEEVEQQVEVFPVGILPIRQDEGYFFLSDYQRKQVSVYSYGITLFENVLEKFRGIQAGFLFSYRISTSQNYEQVKYDLIETNKQLPNPATFVVEFKTSFPLPETMLPVAKRSLMRAISAV